MKRFASPALVLFVCTAGMLLSVAPMRVFAAGTTWYSIIDDTFNRADTSVSGVASSTTAVGNNWMDTNGNVWNISSNRLQGTSSLSSDYLTKFLLRPSSENATNQRIVATIPANENISGEFLGIALRWQSSTFNYYLAHIGTNGLFIYKIVSGATTLVSSQSVSLTATHSYLVDFSATSTSPTNINLVVTDLTSSTTVGSISTTDNESSLQTSGSYGLTTWYNSGVHAIHATRIQTYNDTAPNSTPNAPTNLGPADMVNGSATSTTQPQLSFTITDPDAGDSLRYEIQVDDTSDFSSPVIDYLFPGGPQGARTFQVGQSGGSGASYIAGNTGQTLADASYYWRVRASDTSFATSSYSVANGGAVAFVVNTAPPVVQTSVPVSGGGALPWCSGPSAPGWNVSLPNGGCPGFLAPSVPSATTQVVQSTSTSALPKTRFTRDLRTGMMGEDVRLLQQYLNAHGFFVAVEGVGARGFESTYFGNATARALTTFQDAHAQDILGPLALPHGTGFFGAATRAFVNASL